MTRALESQTSTQPGHIQLRIPPATFHMETHASLQAKMALTNPEHAAGELRILGSFQADNVAAAVTAVQVLRATRCLQVSSSDAWQGLQETRLQGKGDLRYLEGALRSGCMLAA
jgi:folylpolyglutamate synthase/dihydropteroate synthase